MRFTTFALHGLVWHSSRITSSPAAAHTIRSFSRPSARPSTCRPLPARPSLSPSTLACAYAFVSLHSLQPSVRLRHPPLRRDRHAAYTLGSSVVVVVVVAGDEHRRCRGRGEQTAPPRHGRSDGGPLLARCSSAGVCVRECAGRVREADKDGEQPAATLLRGREKRRLTGCAVECATPALRT